MGSNFVLMPVGPIGYVPLQKLDKFSYETFNAIVQGHFSYLGLSLFFSNSNQKLNTNGNQ